MTMQDEDPDVEAVARSRDVRAMMLEGCPAGPQPYASGGFVEPVRTYAEAMAALKPGERIAKPQATVVWANGNNDAAICEAVTMAMKDGWRFAGELSTLPGALNARLLFTKD